MKGMIVILVLLNSAVLGAEVEKQLKRCSVKEPECRFPKHNCINETFSANA